MIEAFGIWTWDARPYPAWSGRADVWSDGDLYPLGHWLNGKVGLDDLAVLVAERCRRVGFTAYDMSALVGVVTGYLRDRPMSPRPEIEALASAYSFDAVETDGMIRFVPRGRSSVATLERLAPILNRFLQFKGFPILRKSDSLFVRGKHGAWQWLLVIRTI